MILILSDSHDVHADVVCKKIESKGGNYFRLNLDVDSLKNTSITFQDDRWKIKTSLGNFYSNEIKAVWNRKTYVELTFEQQENLDYQFKLWKSEWNKHLLGLYYSLSHLPWINYYRNSYKVENKFLQYEIGKKLGFKLPAMISSNDKHELICFAKKQNEFVLKLMHQDFYKLSDGTVKGFFVNKINVKDLEEFNENGENPIVLQEYIEKDFEVRYTIVGNEHFVAKIESQASETANIDWRRYDLPNTPHSKIDAPIEIRNKVSELMKELNLYYGALDFIVSPTGEWYFLEINPNGQYLWIEDLTGLQISNAIADSLIHSIH